MLVQCTITNKMKSVWLKVLDLAQLLHFDPSDTAAVICCTDGYDWYGIYIFHAAAVTRNPLPHFHPREPVGTFVLWRGRQQLSNLYSCTCRKASLTGKSWQIYLRELPRKLELSRHLMPPNKWPWSWHTEPCPEPCCYSLRRTPRCPAPSWPSATQRSKRRCSCSGSYRQHGPSWWQLFPVCSPSSLLFGDQRPE